MSVEKPAVVTGVIIAGFAAIPLFWQESEAKQLREEIGGLEERRTTAAARIADHEAKIAAFQAAPGLGATRSVRDLIAHSEKRIDIDVMMDSIMNVMMAQDMVGMLKIFLPLSNLDRDEYNRLLEGLEAHESNPQKKMMVVQMVTMFAPSDNPSETLQRLVRLEVEPYSYANILGQWGSDAPQEALAWYRQKLETGELHGKGINNHAEQYLLTELIEGISKKDPKLGLDYFLERIGNSEGFSSSSASGLGESLGFAMKETGDDRQLRRLLEWDSDGIYDHEIVASAMNGALAEKPFSEVTRFAETYLEDVTDRQTAVISHLTDKDDVPFTERATQLIGYLPEERAPDAIRQLMQSGHYSHEIGDDRRSWVDSQPAGPIRDGGLRGIVERHTKHSNFEQALAESQDISDESARDEAMVELGSRWLRHDRDGTAARDALPPELIQRIEEQQGSSNGPSIHMTDHAIEAVEAVDAIEAIDAIDAIEAIEAIEAIDAVDTRPPPTTHTLE